MGIKIVINSLFIFNPRIYTQCFSVTETWYLMYRNYEEDPAMGGTAKCVRGTTVGQPEGDAVRAVLEYSPNVTA